MKNSQKNSAKNSENVFAGLPATDPLVSQVQEELREELLALPYAAFLAVIVRLLERQGYRQVRLLGRRGFVGRNRGGGWDLEAEAPEYQPMAPSKEGSRCIIQVKHFDDLAVQQRYVDELRGCLLRANAALGVLITTSRFSPVAQEAAQATPLAPVVLLDGDRLLALLIQQRLGVCLTPGGEWAVDLAFFRSLREEASLNAQTAGAERTQMRRTSRRLSSLSKVDRLPEKRGRPSSSLPNGQVLHLSIVFGAEPSCGRDPETRGKKRC